MDRPAPPLPPRVALRPERPRRPLAQRGVPLAWVAAAAVSVALHLILGGSVLIGARLGRVVPRPPAQGAVELLMVERKGAVASSPAPPVAAPQPPPKPEATPTPRVETADAAPSGRPTAPVESGEAVPQPAPAPDQPGQAAEAKPVPDKSPDKADETPRATEPAQAAQPQKALTFDLNGTDSLSNAEASGGQIIPASPDDRFRNRPPVYPREAAARGEHGAVIVVIHVSERGTTAGADVQSGSGYPALDQAALDAVRKWRFRPALKDGKAVPFDMPMRFVFEAD